MGFKSLFKRKKKQQQSSSPVQAENNSRPLNRVEEELAHVFKQFDANGDGRICAAELGNIMRSLGHDATAAELRQMIAEVDSDGDGFIDLEEFVELNTKGVDQGEVLENLKHAFEVFDIDKNGTISAEELQNVLRSLGEECTFDECRKMIGGVDSDGKGSINFDEFKVMMIGGSESMVN